MITLADIYLWGQHAGTVAWDENYQAASFEFTLASEAVFL